MNSLDKNLVEEIVDAIEKEKYVYYEKIGIVAFDEYFINVNNGFEMVRYNDLLWIYFYYEEYYPKVYFKHDQPYPYVGYYLKNGVFERISVSSVKEYYDEVSVFINYIKMKNNVVEIGYDEETRNRMLKTVKKLKGEWYGFVKYGNQVLVSHVVSDKSMEELKTFYKLIKLINIKVVICSSDRMVKIINDIRKQVNS